MKQTSPKIKAKSLQKDILEFAQKQYGTQPDDPWMCTSILWGRSKKQDWH